MAGVRKLDTRSLAVIALTALAVVGAFLVQQPNHISLDENRTATPDFADAISNLNDQVSALRNEVMLLREIDIRQTENMAEIYAGIQSYNESLARLEIGISEQQKRNTEAAYTVLTIDEQLGGLEQTELPDQASSQDTRIDLVELLEELDDYQPIIETVDCYSTGCLIEVNHESEESADKFVESLDSGNELFSSAYRLEFSHYHDGTTLTRIFLDTS